MLTRYTHAYQTPVVVLNDDTPVMLGYFLDFVIDPETGICVALWVQTSQGMQMLSPKDIVRWEARHIVIADEECLVPPEDLPSVHRVSKKEVPIMNAKTYIEKPRMFLGRVVDYDFDTISPRLLSIVVHKGFWFWGDTRIIARNRITKMTQDGIFVRNPQGKVPSTEPDLPEKEPKPTEKVPGLGD